MPIGNRILYPLIFAAALAASNPASAQPSDPSPAPKEATEDRMRERAAQSLDAEIRALDERRELLTTLKAKLDAGEPLNREDLLALRNTNAARGNQEPHQGRRNFRGGDDDSPRGPHQSERQGSRQPLDPADITDEQIQSVLSFLRETKPQIAEDLEQRFAEDPDAIRTMIAQRPQILRLAQDHAEAPHRMRLFARLGDADRTARAAARAVLAARAENEPTEAPMERLNTALAALYELRLEHRKLEIQELTERLEQLKQKLKSETEQRDTLIANLRERFLSISPAREGQPSPRSGAGRGDRPSGQPRQRD